MGNIKKEVSIGRKIVNAIIVIVILATVMVLHNYGMLEVERRSALIDCVRDCRFCDDDKYELCLSSCEELFGGL